MRFSVLAIGVLVLSSALPSNAAEIEPPFIGQIKAGTVTGLFELEISDGKLGVDLGVSDSTLPGPTAKEKMVAFDWKRTTIWVLADDGRSATPLGPDPSELLTIVEFGKLVWHMKFRFAPEKNLAAVVVKIDDMLQVFPIPRKSK